MTFHHITKSGLTAEKRCRARVTLWNESSTIELTMSVAEVRQLERRFFIDIEDIISDELMGKLLFHFRDLEQLYDQEDLCPWQRQSNAPLPTSV
jgi:hypothetical protein